MESRPKQIIMYLITLEMKRRQSYYAVMGKMPSNFSNTAITQMEKIVSMKDIPQAEKQDLLAEIETFKLITKQ